MLNIYEDNMQSFQEISIKGCKHVSFSNGGHLFAIANGPMVQIYNTFTGDNPPHMVFKGPQGKVKSI